MEASRCDLPTGGVRLLNFLKVIDHRLRKRKGRLMGDGIIGLCQC